MPVQRRLHEAAAENEAAGSDSHRLGGEILSLLRSRVADYDCEPPVSPASSTSSFASPAPHMPAALAAGNSERVVLRGYPPTVPLWSPQPPAASETITSTNSCRAIGACAFACTPSASSSVCSPTLSSLHSEAGAERIRALKTLARSTCDGLRVALTALDVAQHKSASAAASGAPSPDAATAVGASVYAGSGGAGHAALIRGGGESTDTGVGQDQLAAALHCRRCRTRAVRVWVQRAREATLMRLSRSLSLQSTLRSTFDDWLRSVVAEAKLELAARHFAAGVHLVTKSF